MLQTLVRPCSAADSQGDYPRQKDRRDFQWGGKAGTNVIQQSNGKREGRPFLCWLSPHLSYSPCKCRHQINVLPRMAWTPVCNQCTQMQRSMLCDIEKHSTQTSKHIAQELASLPTAALILSCFETNLENAYLPSWHKSNAVEDVCRLPPQQMPSIPTSPLGGGL